MKRTILLSLLFLLTFTLFADKLVLIPTNSLEETRYFFKNPSVKVHFYNNDFVIATIEAEQKDEMVVLDDSPWESDDSYYLVYIDGSVEKNQYLEYIKPFSHILFHGKDFVFVRVDETVHGQLPPAKNDGMVRITNRLAKIAEKQQFQRSRDLDVDPLVQELLTQVTASNITATVQHLQNYGTRDAYTSQSVQAQLWLANQFESLGLEVELMDFTMPSGPASDNVIATQVGTKYPNEYVVVGGHSDSRCWSGPAPGADDNASGTAAVLEIARILSEHQFDRTIIYCAFSGEEYGLYGSAAYASRCAQQGMDILGYFNLDMIGYLQPGNTMLSTLIYPQSATELANFYMEVCSVYLPTFVVQPGSLTGGDSDHTSFNNNGYMGIFPFENINAYSPYIHTTNDIIGPSYNNEAQAAVFTKASLASVVTLANKLNPPRNLVAIPGDGVVSLTWNELFDVDYFKVYRNNQFLASTTANSYIDYDVNNGTLYSYYVTAIYSDSGLESEPSNIVYVTPMPPISLPLLINFENGAPYWNLEDTWGITSTSYHSPSHAITESPNGNYQNNQENYATLNAFSLQGYTAATLSFWTKYDIETNWDFMWLEVSTNNSSWVQLAEFTGTQNTWVQKTYSLNQFLGEPFVRIRFHFFSDYTINRDGMYIDDFEITVEGTGYVTHNISIPRGWSGISSYVVPEETSIPAIVGSLSQSLIVLKDFQNSYCPSLNQYTLNNWNPGSGYMIKTLNSSTLTFVGNPSGISSIQLNEGWNLIPVVKQCLVNTQNLFSSVVGSIDYVKGVATDGVYWPDENINSLFVLTPGKAYMVKANTACTIQFPECTKSQEHSYSKPLNELPWSIVNPTPSSHIISFPSSTLQDVEVGDYIGAFTPDGLCAGAFRIIDFSLNYALAAYANDPYTSHNDGFNEGEHFNFKLFRSSRGQEYEVLVEFSDELTNTELFVNEGASKVESISVVATSSVNISSRFDVFPNPASEAITISIDDNHTAKLLIINQLGQSVSTLEVKNGSIISIKGWKEGVYILKLVIGDRVLSKKLVVKN